MPSIETAIKAGKEARENGSIKPLPAPDFLKPVPVADWPPGPNSYSRGPLPSTYVDRTDTQRHFQSGAVPQQRIPPLSATSNAIVGGQAASQTIQIVRQGSGGPLLETNNIPNNSQTVLNIIAGTNMTASPDAQGGVTLASTGGTTDGLIHGDAVWESDSAYVLLRDDFIGHTTTTANIGELGWTLNGAAGGLITFKGGFNGLPMCGAIAEDNNGTANNFNNINLTENSSTANFFMPLFDYPNWKVTFVFGFTNSIFSPLNATSFAKKSIYIGLGTASQPGTTGWPGRPLIFCGLRYDTDTTAPSIGDTTFHFEVVSNTCANNTRNNTQGTTFDTTIAPAIGTLYRLDIQCVTAGVVTMSLNGSAPQTFTMPSIVSGSSIATGNGQLTNNVGSFSTGAAGSSFTCFAAGSKVTFAGLTGTLAPFNGARTVLNVGFALQLSFFLTNANIGNANSVGTITGLPGVTPLFSFGNDTQAAPAAATVALLMDYFSLIWNPGVGGGTGTPNATKPRYF